jgi:hypothetical protein
VEELPDSRARLDELGQWFPLVQVGTDVELEYIFGYLDDRLVASMLRADSAP